jgi:hypothetical protein
MQRGSSCGETHIQKATYFLQELLRIPLGFDFVLYKHGPFSFDLSDELTAMRADGIVQLKARPPYGPSIIPGPNGERVKQLFPRTLRKYSEHVAFVAEELAGFGVAELERLATAAYVAINDTSRGDDGIEERATRINKLKPHIPIEEARRSLECEFEICNKAEKLVDSMK